MHRLFDTFISNLIDDILIAFDNDYGVHSFGAVIRNSLGDTEAAIMHGNYSAMLSPLCAEACAALGGV